MVGSVAARPTAHSEKFCTQRVEHIELAAWASLIDLDSAQAFDAREHSVGGRSGCVVLTRPIFDSHPIELCSQEVALFF